MCLPYRVASLAIRCEHRAPVLLFLIPVDNYLNVILLLVKHLIFKRILAAYQWVARFAASSGIHHNKRRGWDALCHICSSSPI